MKKIKGYEGAVEYAKWNVLRFLKKNYYFSTLREIRCRK